MIKTSAAARIGFVAAGLACAALLGVGCANPNETNAEETEVKPAPGELSREERIRLRQALTTTKKVETVDEPARAPAIGEVPGELLDGIMADLEGRTGAPRAEFTLERAEAVQWSDGALGCPEPGQMYTQAIVPGYRVVLRHGGTLYDYRAAERGYFKLCANPLPAR